MNQVYSAFMGAAGDDDEGLEYDPFDDVSPYTGNEWWRDGGPRPPNNAEFTPDGVPVPNTPFDTVAAIAGETPVGYYPARRTPYGATYGTEAVDAMTNAIDNDPFAIGQNLGLLGNYMGDSMSSWDDGTTNISW